MSMKSQPKEMRMSIGVDNFRNLQERQGYYVDKTGLITEYLEKNEEVTLVTRPRRFGKTLNMSMMAEFFDITKDSREIFEGTKVMETKWVKEMNQYPVIALSFANVRGNDAEFMLHMLGLEIVQEYGCHSYLWEDDRLPVCEREKLKEFWSEKWLWEGDKKFWMIPKSLFILCAALEKYHGKKVRVFIDEYDTPFIQALIAGYYEEIRPVFTMLLSSVLKGNPSLKSAYLTGIQRVAKENIFSGMNNLEVYTVNDPEYAEYFGFTEAETETLLRYFGMELTDEVRETYDGYHFGDCEVYNPWSITNYVSRKRLSPFWVNTAENSLIHSAIDQVGEEFRQGYEELIEKGSYATEIKMDSSFYEYASVESLWGLLLSAGMLTGEQVPGQAKEYRLWVPNREVMYAFEELTAHHLGIRDGGMSMMFYSLAIKDMDRFEREYKNILLRLPSYHDLKEENSYHMMMLGMCTYLKGEYEVKSNSESGHGRSDICLRALKKGKPHIIMEFKYTKDRGKDLKELANEALEQIREKGYAAGLEGEVLCVGLGHCGKNVEIKWE